MQLLLPIFLILAAAIGFAPLALIVWLNVRSAKWPKRNTPSRHE
jgi:hypothetical protein